jgi:hypothetical protein
MTATQGQPGFPVPRKTNPWLAPAGAKDAISYFDTKRTPARRDYMQMPSGGRHVVIHDVHREREMAD